VGRADAAAHPGAAKRLQPQIAPVPVPTGSGVGVDQVAYPPGVTVGGVEVLRPRDEPAELGSEALQLADAPVQVGGAGGDQVDHVPASVAPRSRRAESRGSRRG
jgi:hypothetical protein